MIRRLVGSIPSLSAILSFAAMSKPALHSQAPDFTAPVAGGGREPGETVTLSKLRGEKVVLYFYPKDDTPG